MSIDTDLRGVQPAALRNAREIAHKAVQLASKAARANRAEAADDSHANLGWNAGINGFVSHALGTDGVETFVGVSLAPLALGLYRHDKPLATLDLGGVAENDAAAWLDGHLEQAGLNPASGVALPYALPPAVVAIETFAAVPEAAALAGWFGLANTLLTSFADKTANLTPGPSAVRCWPHHFDIASYVSLEAGDFETASGIGVGMSPGDDSYDQPYFYINPWPHLDAAGLPDLRAPGHWHTEGFVGAIATADAVLSLNDIDADLAVFIDDAFGIGRNGLAA